MANKTLVYQLFPISWGSIRMMTLFLPRIVALGADYVCLSPIFESPWKNHGYDVSDYYTVEPKLGTMNDFDEFVKSAHAMGLKVILDLPIDSTSVEHNWFCTESHRYIWSDKCNPIKQNISGQVPAWQQGENGYYLALNHPEQATLEWYAKGVIDRGLVECFKKIMAFWLYKHNIDGFRLDQIQLLNDDPTDEVVLPNILIGKKAVTAINELSNLYGGKAPFLIMDLIDPEYGKVCDFYARETDVEFITNRMLKRTAVSSKAKTPLEGLRRRLNAQIKNHKFMLELESYDSPRFTSRSGLDPIEILEFMFRSDAQAICLYQGQELGLRNPKLSMLDILKLDPKAEYQCVKNGASIESLMENSCAYARAPIPLDEYAIQEANPNSVLANTIALVQKWKHF